MRKIQYIVIHCTATQPNTTIESIKRYWKEVRGWKEVPGYHYIIKTDGEIVPLWPEEKNCNGVYAHNSVCISVAYIGGIDTKGHAKDTRTKAQEHAMFDLIVRLLEKYSAAKALGHRDFPGVAKACPSFDVRTWLANYKPDPGFTAQMDLAA